MTEQPETDKPLTFFEKLSLKNFIRKNKKLTKKLTKNNNPIEIEKYRQRMITAITQLTTDTKIIDEKTNTEITEKQLIEYDTESLIQLWEELLDDLKQKI